MFMGYADFARTFALFESSGPFNFAFVLSARIFALVLP